MDEYWTSVIWGLVPTIVVFSLLVFVLRSIIRMDRNERKMYSKVEAEERKKRGLSARDDTAA